MNKVIRILILPLLYTTGVVVKAQAPLTPLWMHIDLYGAGSILCYSDIVSTRLSYDQGNDLIYRSIIQWSMGGAYKIQVFDSEGSDITPATPVVLNGIAGGDFELTQIVQLSVNNDTLSAIVRGEVYFSETDDLNWLKMLGTDGSPIYLLGSGSIPLNAFHRDAMGTLILTDGELRRYGPTGWPDGSISVTPAEGMAVLGNEAVLGAPPSISSIDRSAMTPLPPIVVPSTGTATTSICLANGSSTFNYAALNSNGTMDVGLADINSGPIWSTTISIPSQAQATAYHVDEQGDLWIAVAHNATGVATLGVLYRFHSSDGSFGVNSFSRRIDGIASNGSRLFLTGRMTGSTSDTYVAAFDIDLITDVPSAESCALRFYPNPASTELRVDGLPPGTSRLTVTDVTGRIVKEVQGPCPGSMSIPVTDLPNGTFVLRSSGAGTTTMRSFSVLR